MTDVFEEPFTPVERDRYGRYKLPDPRNMDGGTIGWTRATTLARTLSDEYALNQWRVRQTVYGIGQRQDLFALAAAAHRDDKDTLQDIGQQAQDFAESSKGANLGRALHSFSQRADLDRTDVPDMYRPYIRAYQDALSAAGFEVRPQYIERIVVCPEIKTAGQFDRLLLPQNPLLGAAGLPPRLVVGDLKTAKLESILYAWLEISIQLAVYAHATMMWDQEGKRYHAMPDVDLARAIVMHLPQDLPPDQARCDVYEIDILKGWEYALLADKVREARSGMRKLVRLLDGVRTHPGQPLATKVEEVPAKASAATISLAIDVRTCHTMVNGKPYGCGKPHSGPGQICASCALDLVHVVDGPPKRTEPPVAYPCAWLGGCDGTVENLGDICDSHHATAVEPTKSEARTLSAAFTPLERVRVAAGSEELSALWREGTAAGWWTPELTAAGKARLRELTDGTTR